MNTLCSLQSKARGTPKKVTTPLGGSFEIQYTREGNTRNMPSSRWVVKNLIVKDGMEGIDADSGSQHTYVTVYNYKTEVDGKEISSGKYDRLNREFCGFGQVTEIKADNSTVTNHYLTGFYTKGLLKKKVVRGPSRDLYVVEKNSYAVDDIIPLKDGDFYLNESKYPKLTRTTTAYYEGSTTSEESPDKVTTMQEYAYDDYGNVTTYKDHGTVGDSSDDVIARITYLPRGGPYIVDRPLTIRVNGTEGKEYRLRAGSYDEKGNMWRLQQFTSNGQAAETRIDYDQYGNMTRVTAPENHRGQRYSVNYTYDGDVHTYITQIQDSHGYTSKATYSKLYGAPTYTQDTNRNTMVYSYDQYGRLTRFYGPYDIGSKPTIQVNYYRDTTWHTLTRNKGYHESSTTIDIVRHVDGLGRDVQVKKTAMINGSLTMTLAGRKRFDRMGRVVVEGDVEEAANADMNYQPGLPEYTYDPMGRKETANFPDGSSVSYAYGISGDTLTARVRDQEGKTKRTYKDTRGNIVRVEEELGGYDVTTRYSYNPVNEITKVVDDKGNTTTITYDKMGRRMRIDNPDTGATDYHYDLAGNLTTKVTANLRAKGKAIKYVYWFNRLERTKYPDTHDITYTYGEPGSVYNRAGRVTAVNNGVVKDQFRYGRLGETTWKKRTVGGQSYVLQYVYDSMGRQRRLIYPDGEVLTYVYDAGGLVRKVMGRTGSDTYEYVKNILYNRHGSRTKVEYGNGVSTSYSYDPKMHRLTGVYTKMGARTLQQLQYSYDRVGNITERTDTGFTTTGEETKTVTHTYQYDDLHRLTDAEGTYKAQGSVLDDTLHAYENSFSYDTIGNIMRKVQQHEGPNESGDLATMPDTTYTYNYGYNQARPHAVASINDGGITFRYDASGNMTARYNEEENSWRTLHWDEENRLVKTIDNEVATNYAYDAEGTRVTKSGLSGEVTYVDPAYVIRNNSIVGKHVFVGNTRVASKMDVTGVLADEEDENVEGVYYYHADHLGSSSVVTEKEGGFHERIEYFPYGETWVEDKASTDGYSTPYRYTAKEYDPETGLYYFGARYFDARVSRWVSTDPALQDGKYFPKPYDFDTEHDYYWYLEQDTSKKLPGIGGVFNAVNLDVYHYAGNNPVKLVDPDGNANSYFGVIKGLFNGNFSPFKNRVQYECKAAVYHGKGQSHAYAAGTVAGIISELSGVELQPYALGVSGDYAGEFNNGLKFGKNSTKAIAYTNMARSILQKTGQGVAQDIFKDKESTLKFAEGFIIGMKEGVKPPIKKSNLKTPEEKAGYVVGSIIAELAKQQ